MTNKNDEWCAVGEEEKNAFLRLDWFSTDNIDVYGALLAGESERRNQWGFIWGDHNWSTCVRG
jgi:hypothetical protein